MLKIVIAFWLFMALVMVVSVNAAQSFMNASETLVIYFRVGYPCAAVLTDFSFGSS